MSAIRFVENLLLLKRFLKKSSQPKLSCILESLAYLVFYELSALKKSFKTLSLGLGPILDLKLL